VFTIRVPGIYPILTIYPTLTNTHKGSISPTFFAHVFRKTWLEKRHLYDKRAQKMRAKTLVKSTPGVTNPNQLNQANLINLYNWIDINTCDRQMNFNIWLIQQLISHKEDDEKLLDWRHKKYTTELSGSQNRGLNPFYCSQTSKSGFKLSN